MHIAMDVDHALTAGSVVKSIDVLRERPHPVELVLELGNHVMGAIGPRVTTRSLDLMNVLPRQRWVAVEHGARKSGFDRDSIFRAFLLVKPADAAVRR
jgi:hypothetical protein